MDFLRKLPTPSEVLLRYPLNKEYSKLKAIRDNEIKGIFEGKINKLILIIGPCSADREDAVLEYASHLANVQKNIYDRILIIPRIYTSKPRTIGDGYKGLLHQPFLDKDEDIAEGILAVRRIHRKIIEETTLFGADEMLYPEMIQYVSDLLSYVVVGARSVENQEHRLTASGLSIPVGMKNPVSGGISVMLNSIVTAQHPHHFMYQGWEVISHGNQYAHAVLRGNIDSNNNAIPNYSYDDLLSIYEQYEERKLENASFIIDCNHSNSNKDYLKQSEIAFDILSSMNRNENIGRAVKGLMIESYLEDGCQSIRGKIYGKSITDPCLGWVKTEKLIYDIYEKLEKLDLK